MTLGARTVMGRLRRGTGEKTGGMGRSGRKFECIDRRERGIVEGWQLQILPFHPAHLDITFPFLHHFLLFLPTPAVPPVPTLILHYLPGVAYRMARERREEERWW